MDYSPFYCKNFYKNRRKKDKDGNHDENVNPKSVSAPPSDASSMLPPDKLYAVKSKKRNIFFAAAVILICFALVIVSADLISGGGVLDELKETFGSGYLGKHYLLVGESHTDKNSAEAEAVLVRENGNAGYIYNSGNGYYVVLACFADNKSAQSAKNKSSGCDIIEIVLREPDKDGLDVKGKKICADTVALVMSDIEALYALTARLGSGTETEEAAIVELGEMRDSLLLAKKDILEGGLPETVRYSYLNIVDPLFGGLDAIISTARGEYFLAALKYVLIGGIIALGSS